MMPTPHRIALLALFAMVVPVNAALSSSSVVNDDPVFFDSSIVPSLVTNGQSSLSTVSGTTPSLGFPLGGVNNGSAVGFSGGTMDQSTLTFFDGLNAASATVTFTFSQAYNLTRIVSLGGWGDTFFGSQLFTVLVQTSGSPAYNALGNFGQTPYTPVAPPGFPEVADHGFSVLTTINDTTPGALIANNVTGIRFVYTDPYPGIGTLNGTVIREISVFGTAAVPEPGSCLLTALGAVATLARRRRKV